MAHANTTLTSCGKPARRTKPKRRRWTAIQERTKTPSAVTNSAETRLSFSGGQVFSRKHPTGEAGIGMLSERRCIFYYGTILGSKKKLGGPARKFNF